jgi:replicative superfamily II helicase
LAAGVNLPAGCVLIRSLNIGRDRLNVVQYKQMCGRAGRAGQSTSGDSYLLVKAVEKDIALTLAYQQMPNIVSQMNPDIDGGRALLKSILEMNGLGLCSDLQSITDYVKHTLFFCQQPTITEINKIELGQYSEQQLAVIDIAKMSFEFLLDSRIANYVDISQNSLSKKSIKLTRLGTAMMKSKVDPDEAIVIYDSLLRAQNGINLESTLHILYLVIPLEQSIKPDFKRLLSLYDKSSQSQQKSLAKIMDSVGIDIQVLHKWQFNPPTNNDIDMCTNFVRQFVMYRSAIHDNEITFNTINGVKNQVSNKLIKKEEWKILCCCKRFWAAFLFQNLLEGKQVNKVAKEYGVDVVELENLQSQTKMMASKVQKFCGEIGWSSLEKMISDFKKNFDNDVSMQVQQLLSIPSMTKKVAQLLHDNNFGSIQEFIKASPEYIAQIFKLSIGFEAQVKTLFFS